MRCPTISMPPCAGVYDCKKLPALSLEKFRRVCYNQTVMRFVAFDIGDKRIGVAVSDPFNTYALPSETYFRKGFEKDVAALAQIAKDKGATHIVCGLPVNFDGNEALQTEKTRRFIAALKGATDIPVICEDERFTTRMAHETLISEGMSREKRKNYVDALAAANILDGYLAKLKKQGENKMSEELDEELEGEIDDELVELVDEDGNVINFKLLDVTEYKGVKYALLLAAEPNEEIAEDEVVIFRLSEDGTALEPVEDEALLEEVFDFYQSEIDEDEE